MNRFQKFMRRSLLGEERASVTHGGGTLSNPASWLMKALLGGGDVDVTGEDITPSNCLTISTVYACILTISEDVAKLPIWISKENPDGSYERIVKHPLARIFNVEPNPEMVPLSLRATMTAHALSWGNCFAEIVRMGNGRPAEIWPMLPDRTRVRRDLATGEILYDYTPPGKRTVTLRSYQVLHIPGFGYDGLIGYSPIELARRSLGLTAAAEKYGGSFFGNSSLPKGILEHPGRLGKTAAKNLRETWDANYKGAENANKVGILEEGMKFHAISIPPEDAQFLETRQFQVPEVCRWFRVPPHKVADLSRATFSNIEHQQLDYVETCLKPWIIRWEQEIRRKLFMSTEQDLCASHYTKDILRGDLKSRYDAYAVARQWGWKSGNDILAAEGETPIEPEIGDVYLVPVNMINAKSLPEKPAPAAAPGAPGANPASDPSASPTGGKNDKTRSVRHSEHFREAIFDVVGRIRRVEADKISRNAKRTDYGEWSATFAGESCREFQSAIEPFARAVIGTTNLPEGANLAKEAADMAEHVSVVHSIRMIKIFGPEWNRDAEVRSLAWRDGGTEEVEAILGVMDTRLNIRKQESWK